MSEEPNPYKSPEAPIGNERTPNRHLSPQQMVMASRGQRLLAATLDGLITMMAVMPVMNYLGLFERPVAIETQITVFLLGFLSIIVLHGYLLHTRGQTIGKAFVGIRIVGIDGSHVTLGRIVFMRYLPIQLANQIPAVGPVFSIMDAIWIFREDQRCIHDHIAGTIVVKVNRED